MVNIWLIINFIQVLSVTTFWKNKYKHNLKRLGIVGVWLTDFWTQSKKKEDGRLKWSDILLCTCFSQIHNL
jgi:hypothetical protein